MLLALPVGKMAQVPFEYEAGWAPELIWKFLRRDKSPTPTGIRTSDRLARSLVTGLSAPSQKPEEICFSAVGSTGRLEKIA